MAPDTKWFKKKIEQSEWGSLRQLAFEMGLDPSALSRAISGERELLLKEAGQLAKAFGVKVDEIYRRMRYL